MNIEKAKKEDSKRLVEITRSCARHMIDRGIFQWNDVYPSQKVFENDIALGQCWKLEKEGCIIGIIVLTEIEDREYENVQWLTENNRNLYIHRLAVLPSYQGKGYAQKLMGFGENYAVNNNYNSIRLDTFSENIRNQKFYEKRGYVKLGSIFFPNQSIHPFYCYEKILNV